jgi:formylglycine-generating enzyme required for sulfatase activity
MIKAVQSTTSHKFLVAGINAIALAITAIAGPKQSANPSLSVQSGAPPSTPVDGMVWIEGATFMMGSDSGSNDVRPRHEVAVSGFYMDKNEVTQEAYERATGNNPSAFTNCPQCPVEQVSWQDAKNYCEKVNKRLPTEAEWEFACRAGSAAHYSWGDKVDGQYAWYFSNSEKKTHPVGQKQPNKFGLYDMNGNVYEWCADRYDQTYYAKSPSQNPKGPQEGESRVLRGGSWFNHWDGLRCAARVWDDPGSSMHNIGFRCAR